jgi:hypothetical protein
MTAEEIWDKRGILGGILVVAIFATGLALYKAQSEEFTALIEVETIRKTNSGTVYTLVVRAPGERKPSIGTIRVKNPSGKLLPLKSTKPGDLFEARLRPNKRGMEIVRLPSG